VAEQGEIEQIHFEILELHKLKSGAGRIYMLVYSQGVLSNESKSICLQGQPKRNPKGKRITRPTDRITRDMIHELMYIEIHTQKDNFHRKLSKSI